MSPPHKQQYDPLLECLVIFAKLFHRPVSVEALTAGLPVAPGAAGPELFSVEKSKGLFSRVAKRAGFASRLISRELDKLSDLLLPCILILENRNACIIESIDHASNKAKVILPELGEGEEWIDLDELRKQYLGFAFLLKPEYKAEAREASPIAARRGHWFWSTLGYSREIYVSVLLGSLMINLFALATPLFTMNVYDRVVPNHAIETLWVLAIGVAIVYAFDAILRFIRNYLLEVAGKKSDVIMSSILFEQVMNLRMDRWPKSVGAFTSRLNQFESIRNFFTASTILTLVDLPFTVIFLLVIAYIGDELVAVPLITMAVLLLYGFLVVRPLRSSIHDVFAATAQKISMLVESLHSIEAIKTLGASRQAQWAWEESTGRIAHESVRSRMLSGSIGVVTNTLVQLNMVGLVIFGVYAIIDQNLTLGALIAIVILSSRAIAPMAQVATLVTNYQQTKAAFAALNELMHEPVERSETGNYVRRPKLKGAIEFKNIQFSYPESEKSTLSGLNLRIEPGEHIGIIGRVGCGKTTIAKLLLRLYTPDDGTVTVDGLDIKQIDPADLRRDIGYMAQDVELMRGSIRENITFKDPRAGDEQVLKAAHVAGVDLFVNNMTKGFDTPVGEQGHGLSGGQMQCVALARSLLLDEPIIVLDEPTNSMDNTTESTIRQRLYKHTRDKTLILITHKAPMLDLVERLAVVEAGRVIMDGPKEKVLRALQERSSAA